MPKSIVLLTHLSESYTSLALCFARYQSLSRAESGACLLYSGGSLGAVAPSIWVEG